MPALQELPRRSRDDGRDRRSSLNGLSKIVALRGAPELSVKAEARVSPLRRLISTRIVPWAVRQAFPQRSGFRPQ